MLEIQGHRFPSRRPWSCIFRNWSGWVFFLTLKFTLL